MAAKFTPALAGIASLVSTWLALIIASIASSAGGWHSGPQLLYLDIRSANYLGDHGSVRDTRS
ncbi:hypothetical protein [Arthrobacter psychrochitiniphilus]|uniref:hypothetical protein n=1 Tax=Arthrobacter psychrochitiniphilus TaxID=291045 RepID=UPI0011B8378F|nr:hypothetical protein [Arthrobacter psychrochitiniphilus]NYG19252.1 hypothetical protein [Arthrobacter psychrochitiniphilus]